MREPHAVSLLIDHLLGCVGKLVVRPGLCRVCWGFKGAGYCSHREAYIVGFHFAVFCVIVHAHGTIHVATPFSFSASNFSFVFISVF